MRLSLWIFPLLGVLLRGSCLAQENELTTESLRRLNGDLVLSTEIRLRAPTPSDHAPARLVVDTITLQADIVTFGRDLIIAARNIRASGGRIVSFRDDALIVEPSEPGRNGTPGAPGGTVDIYVLDQMTGTLPVDLRGQTGGTGSPGKPGAAGAASNARGRDGQSGNRQVSPFLQGIYVPFCISPPAFGPPGQRGGDGSSGGAGGAGLRRSFDLLLRAAKVESLVMVVPAASAVHPGPRGFLLLCAVVRLDFK